MLYWWRPAQAHILHCLKWVWSKLCKQEGLPVRHAAEMYGVPKSRLDDRFRGKVKHGTKLAHFHRKKKPFSHQMCQDWLSLHSFWGFCISATVSLKGFTKVSVSYGWWQRYCKQHPELSIRTAVPLSVFRAMATDYVLQKYFDILESTLKKI